MKNQSVTQQLSRFIPLSVGISILAATFCLGLMRRFPEQYIWVTNVLCILVDIVGAVVLMISYKVYWAGAFLLLFALFGAVWLLAVRRRIPFAGLLLSNATQVVTTHWGTMVTSFLSIPVLAVYLLTFVVMVLPTFNRLDNKSPNSGKRETASTADTLAIWFFLISFYWVTQVVINVVHVTASGTTATWYFFGRSNMPRDPSVASLRRAMTTSFGTICLGSLIVAMLKALYTMARLAASDSRSFTGCIAMCFLKCLERLMEYFNVYAFTYVAIYGTSFVEAAKRTWELIKSCGFAAIFNDNLVFPVLTLTSLSNSLAIGVLCGLAAESVLIGVLTAFVAYVVHTTLFRVVYSGIVTLFVCYAECPEALQLSNPTLYQGIQDAAKLAATSKC